MNKLFHKHGRVAFGLLTLIIIVPFVLYFSATPSDLLGMFDFSSKDSKVKMNGESVPQKVLQNSINNTLITMAITGKQVDFQTMRDNKKVIEQAVNRIRLLKAAEKEGVKASDFGVAFYIKNIPLFQVKGKFNPGMYKMFVNYYLRRYRISEKQFEQAAKENMIINMLKSQIVSSVIVTDREVHNYYNDLNKNFNIEVARINSKDYRKDVKIDKAELKKYYEANKDKYLIPAKYKFNVVRFNFIKYKKNAEKNITAKKINSIYESKKDTEYKGIPEKKAKTEIKNNLLEKNIEDLTKSSAQKFAVAVYKQIENLKANGEEITDVKVFDDYAEKKDFTVHKVDQWVNADTKIIKRLGKVPEITSILPGLYLDQPISNAVKGNNAYFVICLSDKMDPRKAGFDEVKEKVTGEYKAYKAGKLAERAAEKLYRSIKKSGDISKAVNNAEVSFKKIPEFSQKNYMPLLKVKDGVKIYTAVTETSKGDVSKPVDVDTGAAIVYVKNITLPKEEMFVKNKKQTAEEFLKIKKMLIWNNYMELLKNKSNTVIADE